ncbi:hypothetical protein CF123_17885 [Aeromonas veronii]|uniref:Morphogenetic protein n=1 Tax=Aeromonas veronii TaxID=654 RepID=A0AAX2UNY0_AERVE|nr:hypothetical protein [Aeromonas veronii]TND51989.1 hypothetical protein CF123_17885 [Aeromonas veronii]
MFAGVGNNDGISSYLKVRISNDAGDMVTAYIGEGSSKNLSSTWTSPFESDALGKSQGLSKAGDAAQTATDMTSVTQFNSRMVWEGTTPPTLNLTLKFLAFSDPKTEVHDAIMLLEKMASPELNKMTPGGRRPSTVTVDVGRRFKVSNVVIVDVSSELDPPRDKRGYMTRNTVQISLMPNQMLNASEIPGLYL